MTNADQRIQALEQEVQLIKAQIQTTLLDIQERLLSSAYPALRIEVCQPTAVAKPAPAPEIEPETTAATHMHFAPEAAAPPVPVAQTMQVAPDVVSVVPHVPQYTEEPAPIIQAPEEDFEQDDMPPLDDFELPGKRPLVSNEDWAALAKIARWINAKVIELGPERTRTLIQMYAYKQNLKPEVMETLLQFVTASEDGQRQSHDARPHGPNDSHRSHASTNGNGNGAKSSGSKPTLTLDRQRLSDWMASLG